MDDKKFDGVPPFLRKCYMIVDDPATESVVSWGPQGNSFIIWDVHAFTDLLAVHFKHNNLASFVRQLNQYGFRKVDPDRFEFAHKDFIKGKKLLLKTIKRGKTAQNSIQDQQPQDKTTSRKACLEVGKFGLEEEVERLKRDKEVLYKELVKLRQQQVDSDIQLKDLRQRIQGMEQNQQQMLSFLAMAVQNPGLFAQFVQTENNKRRVVANKRRRIPALEQGFNDEETDAAPDGQLVKYQPLPHSYSQSLETTSELQNSPDSSDGHTLELSGINGLCVNVDDLSIRLDTNSQSPETTSGMGNSSDSLECHKLVSSGINGLCNNVDGLSIESDPSVQAEAEASAAYADIIQHLFSPEPENADQFDFRLEDFDLDFDLPDQDIQMHPAGDVIIHDEAMEWNNTESEA